MFFSPSILALIFYRLFHGKWTPKGMSGQSVFSHFRRPFSNIDFYMHFGRPVVPLWHPLGSILTPFGTFWVHFGPSWHPLGSILAALGTILAPYSTSGRHFGKMSIFWHPISRKTCKLPLATPTKANFRMHPDFPRPGAGILPQATEIRSGPGFTPPEGVLGFVIRGSLPPHCTLPCTAPYFQATFCLLLFS